MGEDFPALTGFGAGSLVAGYRLEAQVGAGGMAVVFRARDERLGRRVALKLLTPAMAGDHEFRRRFIAESRAAAAVDDPHIIPVSSAGPCTPPRSAGSRCPRRRSRWCTRSWSRPA